MLAIPLAGALTAALVTQDQVALRAAPRDSAPRQAELFRGDWLEVRGERLGFVQVWDHRHERPGYVRPEKVRTYSLDEATAPALHAVVEFVRDTPGAESLGIGAAALFLRAAPPTAVGTDTWDALGSMADRLARRASADYHRRAASSESSADYHRRAASSERSMRRGQPGDTLAGHLAVAESYGIKLVPLETEEGTRLCYDGDAFRHVLALGGRPEERARAALALTRPECMSPGRSPEGQQLADEWRRKVVASVDAAKLSSWVAGRVRMRLAEIEATLAHAYARRGEPARAREAEEHALRQLVLVSRAELAEEDAPLYERTALRVAASRWAAEPKQAPRAGLHLTTATKQPGETCITVVDPSRPKEPPAERCTYGIVWTSSTHVAPGGQALAVAVQPLPGWLELWLFRRGAAGWEVEILFPAVSDPNLGYVELAGWSPDGTRLLVAREAVVEGSLRKSFEVLRVGTLAVEIQARSLDRFATFKKWHSAAWKGRTLALR